jgi:DNA-binding transcriptional MerR regulator
VAKLLTIGQLATHCDVTVRAIRHYHRVGLLPEPVRDSSGYRRYGAKAIVDLVRIKVLADAGVPLAQVNRLLNADPTEFGAAVSGIDQALRQQINQLEHRRHQLAGLLAGDQLVLPPEVADMLNELRAIGVSEQSVQVERDGWILLAALCPEVVPNWTRQKRAALADDEFRRLYLAYDDAREWDPTDPRLQDLAARTVNWTANRHEAVIDAGPDTIASEPGVSLVAQLISPAWNRLAGLSRSLLNPSARPGPNYNNRNKPSARRSRSRDSGSH